MLAQILIICPLVGNLAEIAKTLPNNLFFHIFWGPGPSNIEAKWTKNPFKSHEKSIEKLINILMRFFIEFLVVWGRFWSQVGGHVEAKLAPKSEKWRYKMTVKKNIKFYLRGGYAVVPGPGPLEYYKSHWSGSYRDGLGTQKHSTSCHEGTVADMNMWGLGRG